MAVVIRHGEDWLFLPTVKSVDMVVGTGPDEDWPFLLTDEHSSMVVVTGLDKGWLFLATAERVAMATVTRPEACGFLREFLPVSTFSPRPSKTSLGSSVATFVLVCPGDPSWFDAVSWDS